MKHGQAGNKIGIVYGHIIKETRNQLPVASCQNNKEQAIEVIMRQASR